MESVCDAAVVASLLLHVACCFCYVFGVAKSHAVSWAHFHMARTRRVKPMSFGFSSPRISRCFIMAMNSLLLSSPFPDEARETGQRTDDEITMEEDYHLLMICPRRHYRHSRTDQTPRHTRDPTAPLWPRCGPPASWWLRDGGREEA